MDKRRDWCPLRCGGKYDLPPQRDTSEAPLCYRHECKARNIRRVCFKPFSLNHQGLTLSSEKRATGVVFSLDLLFHRDTPVETRTVRGTKLIVISSGSLGTPAILERSGIGAKDVLEGVGVKQRVDLPGVGENFQGSLCESRQPNTMLTLGLHRSQYPIHSLLFRRRGTDIRCD